MNVVLLLTDKQSPTASETTYLDPCAKKLTHGMAKLAFSLRVTMPRAGQFSCLIIIVSTSEIVFRNTYGCGFSKQSSDSSNYSMD